MILDKTKHIIEYSQGIISFVGENERGIIKEGKLSPFWRQYLRFNGAKIYDLGIGCGSCSAHFERLAWPDKAVQEKIEDSVKMAIKGLNNGLLKIDSEMLDIISMIMPNGVYQVLLSTIKPDLVVPGSDGDYFSHEQLDLKGDKPHDPLINYYRLAAEPVHKQDDSQFFEFLIPTMSYDDLKTERIEYYTDELKKGALPTAVSLTSLNTLYASCEPWWKQKRPEIEKHACMFNFLIDGHHKVYAAALAQKPLTLVSFIAVNQCMEDVSEYVELLENKP